MSQISFAEAEQAGKRKKMRREVFLRKISDATFYKWRAKYGGMDVPDAKRLREL